MATKKAPSDLGTALCLVLRVTAYGEADLILTLFSRTDGLLTARAYGAKSLKSPIRAACQPFCVAEFEFYIRGERRSVKAAAVRADFFRLQESYEAYVCGCIILELMEKVLRHAPEYEEMFRLTVGSLGALNTGAAEPKRVLLFFLLRLTDLLGVFPVIRTCSCCGERVERPQLWSSREGGTVCSACAETRTVTRSRPEVLHCLAHFGRGQLRDLPGEQANADAVAGACRQLLDYLREQYDLHLRTGRMLPWGG